MSEAEEKKGPSKKELKKLAKKAQKDAAKAAAKSSGGGGGSGAASDKAAPSTNTNTMKKAKSSPPVYRLANVPSSLKSALNDACTMKACMGSLLYSQKLLPGGGSSSLPFVHGPALLYGDATSNNATPPVVAFGGNGILKALSGQSVNATVDDWLEFERAELRPALMSGNGKKIDKALGKIAAALEVHGVSVVGNAPLSLADVAITVTLLLSSSSSKLELPPAIQTYVEITQNSSAYQQTKSLVSTLLPPSTSYDPSNPSLLQAASAIFAGAIFSTFPMAQSLGIEIKAFKCKDIKH